MKLLFELRPVDHLEATVDYYRSLGLEPLGWPDDDTAMLGARDGDPTIVLVRDPAESALGAGGVYDVGDVAEFFAEHPGLDWLMAPVRTPLGWYAVFADRTGACIRLLDPSPRLWRAGRSSADLYAVAG
ncbi:hypothetical protein [Kribbella sp. NPDC006257]|jgi:predicted enzyme related to lactoylglutathione lyase|uniref:hypothetical protein n=1 Tax=Kribbella sp. NPDC006257 TaxID=3156738 RepID=UPI0033B40250